MSDDPLRLVVHANGAPFISLNNQSSHWVHGWRLRVHWKHNTQIALAQAGFPKGLPRCEVRSLFFFTNKRRRDPHNFVATLKPIIDQMVVYGCWPDDTAEYVTVAEPLLEIGQVPAVSLIIKPLELKVEHERTVGPNPR